MRKPPSARTIAGCLAARERITGEAGLALVEIVVVSDGSTDRTAEIAKSYEGVKVIVFPKNRGYGAAIKEGWRQGTGNLLGFLDADGTCDPLYFAELCRAALEESADVVVGSRLGPDSKMPPVRQVGNHIYAFLVGLLCGRQRDRRRQWDARRPPRVAQVAVSAPRRPALHPVDDARALLNDLRLIEVPMPYQQRVRQE